MEQNFKDGNEKLFRGIRCRFLRNGKISTAAFKLRDDLIPPELELSMDRQGGRSLDDCIDHLTKHFTGHVASLLVQQCLNCELTIISSPSRSNPWHTSVYHGTPGNVPEEIQIALSRLAVIEHMYQPQQ